MKNIRNNFLNAGELFYPAFKSKDGSVQFPASVANIEHIRNLYFLECSQLIKLAPKLTGKAMFPTNFERQRTNLALALFDDTTIAALSLQAKDNPAIQGTVNFLVILNRWWKIVNVKNPNKGIHKRDIWAQPVNHSEDPKLIYLLEFADWIS